MTKSKKNSKAKRTTTVVVVDKKSTEPSKPTTGPEKPAQLERDAKVAGDKSKPKKLGVLAAAAQVLAEADQPLNCVEMVQTMLDKGLWKTGGKTPASTLYSALIREIAKKGDAARFRKIERGKFTSNQ